METRKVPKSELINRMNRFISAMDKNHADWEICAIVGDMSLYYLTGTICDGVVLIRRGKDSTLWVRRSYDRAVLESEFPDIKAMKTFRDIANHIGTAHDTLYIDMSAATMEWYSFLSKHVKFENVKPADNTMLGVRAVKSQYEIDLMKSSGSLIDRLLRESLPPLLHEGMSEAELGAELFSVFIKNGYHGVNRNSMRNADVILGHIGFSESSLYPSVFNGASGIVGMSPAAPVLGSRNVKLKEGDLIYIDFGFGTDGYQVDKTRVYSYKKPQSEYVNDIHRHCVELEKYASSLLRAGTKPSYLYDAVCESVRPELRDRFMGLPGRTVPFLGHGVGLFIDELPVIAKGFDEPLEFGMTIAIEPKMGIEGVGIVGSENTYLITESDAICLTGAAEEIVVC